jgi:hypothetical protein
VYIFLNRDLNEHHLEEIVLLVAQIPGNPSDLNILCKEVLELVQVNLKEQKAHSAIHVKEFVTYFSCKDFLFCWDSPNIVLSVLVDKLEQKQTLWWPAEVHHHHPADPADPPP